MKVKSLSRVQLFATPWTVAYQAPPTMGFPRQEYWSRLPFPSPGDLPDPGIEPGPLHCRQTLYLSLSHQGSPHCMESKNISKSQYFQDTIYPKPLLKGSFSPHRPGQQIFRKCFFFFFQNDYFKSEEACGVNSVVLFYKGLLISGKRLAQDILADSTHLS